MTLFTDTEFTTKYGASYNFENWQIEAASEMIFSQVGLRYRQEWTAETAPTVIKNAAMEQLRFILEHDIPFIDQKHIKAGDMEADISTDYSTLALRMLSNAGYLYRGSPLNANLGLEMKFGG